MQGMDNTVDEVEDFHGGWQEGVSVCTYTHSGQHCSEKTEFNALTMLEFKTSVKWTEPTVC